LQAGQWEVAAMKVSTTMTLPCQREPESHQKAKMLTRIPLQFPQEMMALSKLLCMKETGVLPQELVKQKSRSSLGQHFTEEEKQLQLVTKQQQEGVRGLKLKRMVSRYAKVLSHLIKVKGDSRKKPLLLLKM